MEQSLVHGYLETWPCTRCWEHCCSETAEHSALVLTELIEEAGFPSGVVNIVNGYGREAGAALSSQ